MRRYFDCQFREFRSSAKGQIDLRPKGFALRTPTTFEKVDETFAWLRSSDKFGFSLFLHNFQTFRLTTKLLCVILIFIKAMIKRVADFFLPKRGRVGENARRGCA